MKGNPILVLAALLSLSIPAGFSTTTPVAVEYTFTAGLVHGQWVIEDTVLQEIPGEPLMPYYSAQILLPQGAEVKDVTVTCSTPVVLKGITIPWGQPPSTFSTTPEKVGPNKAVYNSNQWYPQRVYDVVSVESFRGFQIATVMLYPLQYKPKSGTVKFYETMTVEIHTGKGIENSLYRGLEGDKAAAVPMVDNPDMTASYSLPESVLNTPYEYIIITNSELTSAFSDLIDHKAAYVDGARIVDVSWIYATYTGYDNPEKIRNFIIDAYNDWDTTYCLLGGDVDVVPRRLLYVTSGDVVEYFVAADMYYGCLDGTFDADSDHIYGEPEDGVDWLEEVYIGRAPVDTAQEAQDFVDKVIAYELAAKPEVCQFLQARGTDDNDPDFRQIAWDCEQWVPNSFERRELFEEDDHITKDDWRTAWAGNPLTFQHTGHGDTTHYNINYIVGGSTNWYTTDVSSLTNTFWPVHMSVACFSGDFDNDDYDCLAEEYIKDDCGAVACLLNDSYGWFSYEDASKYSGDFLETMFRALFIDGKQHLGELLNQAKSYWVLSAQRDVTYKWCYYEINLLGDPETPCLTRRKQAPSCMITGYKGLPEFARGGILSYSGHIAECTDIDFLTRSSPLKC